MADNENAVTPTPENPIPDVDEIKPGIPDPAWKDEGGSDLPAVTSQDAGKVLTVSNDGEWVAGSGGGGGGGGAMMVCISGDETLTMDKTFGEIKSTILTTAVVFQYVVNDGGVLSVIPFTVVEFTDSPEGKVISMLADGEQYRFIAGTDADYPTT